MKKGPPRWTLWLLTVCVVFFVAVRTVYAVHGSFFWSSVGVVADPFGAFVVKEVKPGGAGERAGVAVGDRILRADGSEYVSFAQYLRDRQAAERQRRFPVALRKPNGEVRSCTLELQPEAPPLFSFDAFFVLSVLMIGFLCSGVGLTICWLRWEDATARPGGLFFLCVAALFGFGFESMPLGLRVAIDLMTIVATCSAAYLCFVFFSEFPSRSAFAGRWRWVRRAYGATLAAVAPSLTTLGLISVFSFALRAKILASVPEGFITALSLTIVAGFASPFLNFIPRIGGVMEPDQRRRFRVFTLGAIIGCAPLVILLVVNVAFRPDYEKFPWILAIPLTLFPAFPLSFAYVVVKHRVLGVQQILRSGVRYLFLSRGYLLIEFFLFYLVVQYPASFLLEGLFRAFDSVPPPSVATLVGLSVFGGLFGAAARINPYLQTAIDRRFFREAYQAQQVLRDLTRSIRGSFNPDEILQKVAERVDAALHVKNVTFLLRPSLVGFVEGDAAGNLHGFACRFEPGAAAGIESALTFPTTSPLIKKLEDDQEPTDVDFDENSPSLKSGCDHDEREILRRIGANLLVPLIANDSLLGLLSLGAKLSEEPYTREDKSLLMAVAESVALRLENTQLIKRLTAEASMRRELEIAREMQRSLLPAGNPAVSGVSFSGYSSAANDVGGDYYDYFMLDDGGRLAVAVGDVTGHGVSSGLLMALAKGGLHNQVCVDPAPVPVMEAMNRLICASGGKRDLMSFIYAVVDARRRTLEFANAGHPFPYHFRRKTARAEAIETTAYPLGVKLNARYATATIALEPGDAVIFYTDGVVEAQNARGTVFGYERLEQAVVRHGTAADAAAIQAGILSELARFTEGRAMDDDVTLVILHVARQS